MQSQGFFRAARRRIAPKISITTASPADLEYVQTRLNPGVTFIPNPPDPWVTRLVAVRHERVIGFVELVRHPPEHAPFVGFWLFSLYVLDPLYRGSGIGEALACHAIGLARREGAKELWLVVGETNCPAINLYRKLGFERAVAKGLEERYEDTAKLTGSRSITMVKQMIE